MSDVILGLVLPIPICFAISICIMCCKLYCELVRDATAHTENPIRVVIYTTKEEECTDPI